MKNGYSIIIPARYGSSRLPGKPLLQIKGKPLIQHVYETASTTKAKEIIIATDNDDILNTATSFGCRAILTSEKHQSGTDRVAEIVEKLDFDDDEIIINLQGDEYGLQAELIDSLASNLSLNIDSDVATLCEPIQNIDDYTNPNIVKVVFDNNNKALFFSRSPIPAETSGKLPVKAYRHIGLYAYRVNYLMKFTKFERCDLEKTEKLEQLRIIYNKGRIQMMITDKAKGIGVDTEKDLQAARSTKD